MDQIKKERYEKFLISKKRVLIDKTLSPNALKVIEFLCKGIESENDFINSLNLPVLIRGGKYNDELRLSGEDLEQALNEIIKKDYTFFY